MRKEPKVGVIEKIKEYKVILISMCIVASLLGYIISQKSDEGGDTVAEQDYLEELVLQPGETENNDQTVEDVKVDEPQPILVDVKGAVNSPGVYELDGESRVIDAIDRADGLTQEADTRTVNFAKQVTDGMLLYIPKEGEEILEEVQQAEVDSTDTLLININKAAASELEQLTGIGPKKAQEIINYRENEGRFKTVEELTNVSGIGVKTFEKLKDQIVID